MYLHKIKSKDKGSNQDLVVKGEPPSMCVHFFLINNKQQSDIYCKLQNRSKEKFVNVLG